MPILDYFFYISIFFFHIYSINHYIVITILYIIVLIIYIISTNYSLYYLLHLNSFLILFISEKLMIYDLIITNIILGYVILTLNFNFSIR